MKKTFLILIFLTKSLSANGAVDYLTYLATNPPWKNYVPLNYEVVKKKGESAFFWSYDADPESINDSNLKFKEPFFVFKPKASVDVFRKTNSGQLIYKTSYNFDDKSRRIVPLDQEEKNNKRNLLFLGCSFTFGTGVADDETYPYYFSQYRPHFNVFNLGIQQAGANDVLDDLKDFSRFKDVPKTGGIVFYTALYEHIERSVCNWSCYTNINSKSILKKSHYQYDSTNQVLINRGSFENSQPVSTLIFSILGKIGMVESITIPFKLTDEQIELYVMMIAEMKKISKDKLNADFFLTMYPGYYENWDRIKPFLKKYGIRYLDLSKMDFKKSTNLRNSIVYDGHPTPLAHYMFASLVHHQLPK